MEIVRVRQAFIEPPSEILEELPLSAGYVDRDGIVQYANRFACESRNVRREDLVGRSVFDLLPPGAPDGLRAILERALKGEAIDQEFPSPRVPGAWLRVMLRPIRDDAGAPAGFVALQFDVSDRRAAQQREQSTHDLLQHILVAAPAGIAYVDRELRYVFGNEMLARRWGVAPRELVGRSLESMFGAQFAVAEPYLRRALQGESVRFELAFEYPTGPKTVDVSCVPHVDPAGKTLGFVAAVVDVTERKKRETLLQSLQGELEDLVAARTRELSDAVERLRAFNYTVSHDLRGPLHGLVGFLEAAAPRATGAPELQEGLSVALESGRRMQAIIDSLLQLAVVTHAEPARRDVDVTRLAADHLNRLQRHAGGRSVRATIEPGLVVRGDPGLVEVAVSNLLDNAWKFTSRRSDSAIEVGSIVRDGKRWIYVRDNGVGFDPAAAGALFTPFSRLATASGFEGTGIGLATVAGIARRHGGDVRAESEPGNGATFYLWLP